MNLLVNPVIHPLLQIVITFFLCSGVLGVGRLINQNLFKNYNFYFFDLSIATIFLSQIIFIAFIFGFFQETIMILSYFLLLFGILNLIFSKNIKILINFFIKNKTNNLFEIVIFIILLLFIIISLGPPSMSDGLDYHYGVSLHLLNYSNIPNQNIWVHGSLFGIGEFFNTIGLYLKSDNFFTFFQLLSLIFFFEFLAKNEKDKSKFFFIIFFIISSPVLLFLISGPKSLLFPQLLTTASLYIFIKEKNFSIENTLLISILLIGATQFKLSFILSGSILGLLVFIKAIKNDKKVIFYLIFITLFFFLPKIIYNYNHVSEFKLINIFTTLPYVFLDNLSNFRDNNFIYPFNLFIFQSLGGITTILGFQVLFLFFIKKISKEFYIILIITILTILLHVIFGQQTSRLYYEFILWLALGFCFIEKKDFKFKFFTYAIFPQFILVFFISIYFAANILPSLISLDYRDKFMAKNSHNYQAIKWANNQIPKDVVIISELRSNSFFENEVIPLENIYKLQETNEYLEYLKLKKPKLIINKSENLNNHFLENCIGDIYKTSEKLNKSTRNPFNRGDEYKVYIYHFNYDKLNYCVNLD